MSYLSRIINVLTRKKQRSSIVSDESGTCQECPPPAKQTPLSSRLQIVAEATPQRIAALERVLDGLQVGGSHYKCKGIQPIVYSLVNAVSPQIQCVIKYVTRHKEKGGHRDLDKAIHYILMERAWEYPDAPQITVIFPNEKR